VSSDPANCYFNIFVGPWSKFGDCDEANDFLTKSGLSFDTTPSAAGSVATLTIGADKKVIEGFSPFTWSKALIDAGYPLLKSASSTIALTKEQSDAVNRPTQLFRLPSGQCLTLCSRCHRRRA
jgi:hypothetical protein